jgi:hypothetical protein
MPKPTLALSDESTAGPYVTGGIVRLPTGNVAAALEAITVAKEKHGVAADARIHCRILFHPDARRKSAFKHLRVDDIHELLVECVLRLNSLGASWWGAWADQRAYPKELQLVDGERFAVSTKHLAGLVCFAALSSMEHRVAAEYDLAFDPDPTKIDWGLVRRQQATHFARVHPNAIELADPHKSLLQMADVAAHTLAQSQLALLEPGNRKAKRFPVLLKRMSMEIARFAYEPPSNVGK